MKVWTISLLIYLGAFLLSFIASVIVVSRTHLFLEEGSGAAILIFAKSGRWYLAGGLAISLLTVLTDWELPGFSAYAALCLGSMMLGKEALHFLSSLHPDLGRMRSRLLVTTGSYVLGAGGLLLNILFHL